MPLVCLLRAAGEAFAAWSGTYSSALLAVCSHYTRFQIRCLLRAQCVQAGCIAANGTQLLAYQECQLLTSDCSLVSFEGSRGNRDFKDPRRRTSSGPDKRTCAFTTGAHMPFACPLDVQDISVAPLDGITSGTDVCTVCRGTPGSWHASSLLCLTGLLLCSRHPFNRSHGRRFSAMQGSRCGWTMQWRSAGLCASPLKASKEATCRCEGWGMRCDCCVLLL